MDFIVPPKIRNLPEVKWLEHLVPPTDEGFQPKGQILHNPLLKSIIATLSKSQEFREALAHAVKKCERIPSPTCLCAFAERNLGSLAGPKKLEDLLTDSTLKVLSKYPTVLVEKEVTLGFLFNFAEDSIDAQKDQYYSFLAEFSVLCILLRTFLEEPERGESVPDVRQCISSVINGTKRLSLLEDILHVCFFTGNQLEGPSKIETSAIGIWGKAKEATQSGFLCQDSAVFRSVLELIEAALPDLDAPDEQLGSDLKRLSQNVSELKWKLDIIDNLPPSPVYNCKEAWLHEIYAEKSSESEEDLLDKAERRRRESTESSDTSKSCTSPEIIPKHKRVSKGHSRVKNSARSQSRRSGIVSKLLCSPKELAVLCLVSGQLSQALEIVKLWGLWEASEGHEVLFAKAFDDLRQKLVNFDRSAMLRSVSSPAKFSPKGVSPGLLKGLRRATTSSLGSSAIPNLVEDLVSNSSPGPVNNAVDMDTFLRQFVPVDLAISGNFQHSSTHTLLNMVDAESGHVKVYPISLRDWYSYVNNLKHTSGKLTENRDGYDLHHLYSFGSASALLTRNPLKDSKAFSNDLNVRFKAVVLLNELETSSGLKEDLDVFDKLTKLFEDSGGVSFVKGMNAFFRAFYEVLQPYGNELKSLEDMTTTLPQDLVLTVFLKLSDEKVKKLQTDLYSVCMSLPYTLAHACAPELKVRECEGACECKSAVGSADSRVLEYLSEEMPICVHFLRLSKGDTAEVPDYLISYVTSKRRQILTQEPTGGLQICLKEVLERFVALVDKGQIETALSVAANSHPPFLQMESVLRFLYLFSSVAEDQEAGVEAPGQGIKPAFKAPGYDVSSFLVSNLPPEHQAQIESISSDPVVIYEIFLMNGLYQQIMDTVDTLKSKSKDSFLNEKLDSLFLCYAEKALLLEEDVQSGRTYAATSKASSEPYLVLGSTGSSQSPFKQESVFQMPVSTPLKEDWIPDTQVAECMCCRQVAFSIFNRRHHCRRCGRVVCSSCSRNRMKVSGYKEVPVKICNDCYQQTEELRAGQQTQTMSGSLDNQSQPPQGVGYLPWTLTGDSQHDDIVRAEFAYESAPDAQLCIHILELVSNLLTSSDFLLSKSEKLLEKLNSKSVSDRTFLLQVVKSLILAAKVQISAENTKMDALEEQPPENALRRLSHVMRTCDSVSSRLDVVVLLEAANCSHLLNKRQPNFRQLRQKLIDEERWQLALEVSTKCGLDASTVWASWGLVCLKAGNLNGARSRLGKCLEPRRVSPILDEIVNVLENLSRTPNALETNRKASSDLPNSPQYLQSRLDRLNAIAEGVSGREAKPIVRFSTKDTCLNEAEYYLKTFGSPQSLLSFYARHGMISAGVQYTKRNKISDDVFVGGFFIPVCQMGLMEEVLKVIKQLEPMLEFWKSYLHDVCKELRRKLYLHTAKRLYCWIGDSVQAGQICFAIYSSQATNFTKLASCKYLLTEAELHFNQYLESKIAMGFTLIDEEVQSVESMVKTIKLQSDVHDYLLDCQAELQRQTDKDAQSVLNYLPREVKRKMSREASTSDLQKCSIPTLFEDETSRKQVIHLMIVLPPIDTGRLQLAWRICLELDLPWNSALEKAILQIVAERRLSEFSVLVNFARYQQRASGQAGSKLDEILCRTAEALNANEPANKDTEMIVQLIETLQAKVTTFLNLGWLQSAYALAVRSQSVADVRRIQHESEVRNETGMQRLCANWLSLYGNRS